MDTPPPDTRRSHQHGAVAAFALTLGLFAVHAATWQSPGRTLYIALGDSYAAGDGIPTQFDIPSGCERSRHSHRCSSLTTSD